MVPGTRPMVPGEPEARCRSQRLRDGVPLSANTWAAIRETAASVGVVEVPVAKPQ
jgi:LDH2 family malate/lactate/ureidoglycolate dehydrogenase